MKVLYSNPPWWDGHALHWGWLPVRRAGNRAGSRWPHTFHVLSVPGWRAPFDAVVMPFFMSYAGSYVAKSTGAEVTLRDSIGRRESYGSYYRFIRENFFDYIFFESATPSWDHDRQVLLKVHELSPASKIVMCGPITSEKGQEILDTLPVAACIKGEYEKGSVEVINGRTGVVEHNLLTEEEMNSSPWPLYDEACARAYYDRNPRGTRTPQAQVWASRGCPFKCIFCVWPATMTGNDPTGKGKRRVRYYSAEYLEPFLRHVIAKYGYRSIYFDDDTFNLGTRHTLEMCALMKKIGLPWSAMCRADTIRMNVWDEMKASGCYGVKLGFESGNQYVVDKIVGKELDLQYGAEVVRYLRKIGMSVHGTFTVGLPGETAEQMAETLAFAKALPLNSAQISGTAEIEGTPLHELRKGKLEEFEGASFDQSYVHEIDGIKKAERLSPLLRGG